MISTRQLFHESREQEIQNESIEDLQNRIDNSLDQIQEHFEYFFSGIQSICETHNPNQDD